MDTLFQVGAHRYQASETYIYAADARLRFDQRRLASLVGYVALGLPVVLGVGGLIRGELRSSLSNYYYEALLLGDIFVGCLVFIGTLLLAYRGWSRKVARLASVAGVAAFFVALFPHQGWASLRPVPPVPALLEGVAPYAHFAAAASFFLVLAFFCLFVFTKVEPHQTAGRGEKESPKRKRDAIYRVSGVVILVAVAAIAVGSLLDGEWTEARRLVYWMEYVALMAFGVSWIVQGRASGTLLMDRRDHADVQAACAHDLAAERREQAV